MQKFRQVSKVLSLAILFSLLLGACAQAASPLASPTTPPTLTNPTTTSAPQEAATTSPTALSASTPTGTTSFTVTDALGRIVSFDQAPRKIALVGKAVIMVADGVYLFPQAEEKITAISEMNQSAYNFISMIDPNFSQKGLLAKNVGPEQIAAVQPDAVIMKSTNVDKLGKPLEALNIPVIYLDLETPEQYQRDILILGTIFQDTSRAEAVAKYFQDGVDTVNQTLANLPEAGKPRTLLLYYEAANGTAAFNVPPKSWIQTTMVNLSGAIPVWQDFQLENGWTTVSLEQIAAWNPDVIFVTSYSTPIPEVMASLKADPKWQALAATQNGKLFGFAADVYSWDQPDTRWILGLKWMAKTLHPDLFADVDIMKEAQNFYSTLYAMDQQTFQAKIVPLLQPNLQ